MKVDEIVDDVFYAVALATFDEYDIFDAYDYVTNDIDDFLSEIDYGVYMELGDKLVITENWLCENDYGELVRRFETYIKEVMDIYIYSNGEIELTSHIDILEYIKTLDQDKQA